MTLTSYLAEIRGRLKAATPGPWTARCEQKQIYPGTHAIYPTGVRPIFMDDPWDWTQKDRPEIKQVCNDADLIANAPVDLARLLEIVEIYREALMSAQYMFEECKMPQSEVCAEALAKAEQLISEKK